MSSSQSSIAEKMYTTCTNPATGEVIGQSEITPLSEVAGIIEKARSAQLRWSGMPLRQRIIGLRRVQEYLVEHKDEIAEVIAQDNGKVRVDAMTTEVLPAAMAIAYYSRKARRFLRPKGCGTGNLFLANKRSQIIRQPFGVIAIISPWNYPFAIPFSEVVMALLAGNAVVLKVASETQLVGRKLEECFRAAELPDGIFQYINVPGKDVGDALFAAGIDKLFFTGSVAVGKYLMSRAGQTLTPVVLELGGNDPMIVCEDADLARAVGGAVWAGFSNCGQSCGGIERIYVAEKVYGDFLELLKNRIDTLRIGYDTDFQVDLGAMTTERQVVTVQRHIEDALNQGAEIYAQSKIPETLHLKNFLPATVLVNVNHNMLVMKDETFGPVVGVMKFRYVEEAVTLANDSYLGLTASVWSRNRRRAIEIGKRLKAGVITINDHLMSHGLAETPWGGFKQSGIGRTHGEIGFEEMTQPQVIVDDKFAFTRKNLWWPPYSEKLYHGLSGLLDLLYAKKISRRLRGFGRILKILPRILSAD